MNQRFLRKGFPLGREFITEGERKFFFSGKKLPQLYIEYLDYSKNIKELAIGSIQNRKKFVLQFLVDHPRKSTPKTIKRITPATVQEYTMDQARELSRNMKRSLVIALRDFFRFLHLYEYTSKDLSKSVPTIVTHRLSSVPKGMPWSVVEKLLRATSRRTFGGKRDYAIILMFARYGVRAIQLRNLEIGDIDWRRKTIIFQGCKGGKAVEAPLFEDVAKALLDYFKSGRKTAPKKYRQVFLTTGTHGSSETGQRPLHQSTWNIVNKALQRIGSEVPIKFKRGPHAIRHAYATKLLDDGEPIKNIADLLGHRSLETTFIYTKSSMKRLRPLTQEWPEVLTYEV